MYNTKGKLDRCGNGDDVAGVATVSSSRSSINTVFTVRTSRETVLADIILAAKTRVKKINALDQAQERRR